MKIWVLYITFFTLSATTLMGQGEYFSIQVGRDAESVTLFDAAPTVNGGAIVSIRNNNNSIDQSKYGWIEVDSNGHIRDSFYYAERNKTSDFGYTLMLLGDTVLQLATHPSDRKVLTVHGSSYSQKDSIFRWQYDFTDIPYISLVLEQSLQLNKEGNIIIMGTYSQAEPGALKLLMNVYLVELSRDGELLRRTKVTEIREHSNPNYVRVTSRILEKDDAYYVAIQRENRTSQYIIVKMDKLGNLIWSQDGEFGFYGGAIYTMPELFFSKDSTRLQVIHCRADDYGDLEDHIADSLYNLYGVTEIVLMREYDIVTGERLSHYEKPIYRATIGTYGAAKSSVTGEIVFGGEWFAWDVATPAEQYNGCIGKVTEEGEFKTVHRVMDEFGHPFDRGQ